MSEYPRPYVVIPDKSHKKDSFGKGVIEERQTVALEPTSARKPMPVPISIPSAPVAVDSHLSTLSNPPILHYVSWRVSPYFNSSSNPSHKSSPPVTICTCCATSLAHHHLVEPHWVGQCWLTWLTQALSLQGPAHWSAGYLLATLYKEGHVYCNSPFAATGLDVW